MVAFRRSSERERESGRRTVRRFSPASSSPERRRACSGKCPHSYAHGPLLFSLSSLSPPETIITADERAPAKGLGQPLCPFLPAASSLFFLEWQQEQERQQRRHHRHQQPRRPARPAVPPGGRGEGERPRPRPRRRRRSRFFARLRFSPVLGHCPSFSFSLHLSGPLLPPVPQRRRKAEEVLRVRRGGPQ